VLAYRDASGDSSDDVSHRLVEDRVAA